MPEIAPSNAAPREPTPLQRVRWRHSLFFQVVVLCVILVLCLLGSVVALTQYYISESVREMEAHAGEITHDIYLALERNPDITTEDLVHEIQEAYNYHAEFRLETEAGELSTSFRMESRGDQVARVVEVPLEFGPSHLVLTLRATTAAQAEILRAFRNRYMLALISVFLLTICLMVYFIARALRPLRDLSYSLAAVSSGQLRQVSTRRATGEVRALEDTFNHMVDSLREKEMMETKLRQAQRLSALGNLAAGVAHDVRNPLNAIKLLSSHAMDTLDRDSPAEKPLRTIRAEVNRLEDIVSSFLSLAKERELVLEPCTVDSLLEECMRLFRQEAEARELRLIHELRAGEITLMLDPKQFTRAILNILLNALEACPPGGRVRLFSRRSDHACEIEIRDDGPGMPREVMDRVFDPYYTTKPGGTGLGLSITRGIVEEHGGSVELTCVEGQGCQVLITLPLEKMKAP